MKKAMEEFIEGCYLVWTYHHLEKCIKDDPKNVTSTLTVLRSQTANCEEQKLNMKKSGG